MANAISSVKSGVTGFWHSAERNYVVAAGAAVISSFMVVPPINKLIAEHLTTNTLYIGLIDIAAGIFLIMLSMKASHGWAALGVGIAFSFIAEGIIRILMPSVAEQASLSGQPALVSALAGVHL